ncbi:ABC transporter permease [Heyndrickxia coagulans]|uniref:ABC transporter permease n=1 Tax=Heyndrickxia coagulans TaxID=1398 RepID=UPI00077952E0|nr:ABC transporter permease [Heyndrickxia coagulans]KYC89400.1 hypothetical protein B4096_0729 [Heyndrickxia coagulans]
MGLIKLETLRFIRNKKNLTVFIAAILIVFILFAITFVGAKRMDPLNEYQDNKSSLENAISHMESNPNKSEAKKKALAGLQEELRLRTEQIQAHEAGDWKQELKLQIALDKKLIAGINAGTIVFGNKKIVPQTEKAIQLNTILLKQNIHPVIESFETPGINFTYRILFYVFPFLMPLLIAVLIGDISTRDKQGGINHFVNVLPVKLKKILDARIFTSFVYSLAITIVILVVALIIGSIISHLGSWKYPVAINLNGTEVLWISIARFLGRSLLLILCLLLFISVFTQLLNTFIRNQLLLMLVLVACFCFEEMMSGFKTKLYAVMHIIPFTFVDVPNIVNGESAAKFRNEYINTTDGVITLLLSSLLFYFLTIWIIHKKNKI